MPFSQPPGADEYAPFYDTYVSLVPPGNILETLRREHRRTAQLLGPLDEAKALHRYAEGKWSIKELVGHLVDTERIFAFRALCFARLDPNPLPGMEQEPYVEAAAFDRRPLASLLKEWDLVREANLELFASWDEETLGRQGQASGFDFTVRALVHIIAGHELHHRRILEERYL